MSNETIYLFIYLSGFFIFLIGYLVSLRFGEKDKEITIGDAVHMFGISLTSWFGIITVVLAYLFNGVVKLGECDFWKKKLFTIKTIKR